MAKKKRQSKLQEQAYHVHTTSNQTKIQFRAVPLGDFNEVLTDTQKQADEIEKPVIKAEIGEEGSGEFEEQELTQEIASRKPEWQEAFDSYSEEVAEINMQAIFKASSVLFEDSIVPDLEVMKKFAQKREMRRLSLPESFELLEDPDDEDYLSLDLLELWLERVAFADPIVDRIELMDTILRCSGQWLPGKEIETISDSFRDLLEQIKSTR